MKRAKVYLTNGEVADIKLMFSNTQNWIDDIIVRGISTANSYFPYHSISYILFEDIEKDDDEGDIEVEYEPEPDTPKEINIDKEYERQLVTNEKYR